MATKALGIGTCNLSVNVRIPVRAALGRMAFTMDVSMGELVRRLIEIGVNFARLGRELLTQRSRAEHLAAELRRITADGVVTPAEVRQLTERCAPEAESIASGCEHARKFVEVART